MKQIKKAQVIAWDIAHEIMIRSVEPLVLFMLHPGGEQYECLSILRDNGQGLAPNVMINLYGNSISAGNEFISPYTELCKKDKKALLNDIAVQCGFRLSDTPVRKLTAMSFLMKLLALTNIEITAAWHEGSYFSGLENAVGEFPYYPLKTESDFLRHIPWWTITANGITIAMVNLDTEKLIAMDGSCHDLKTQYDLAMQEVLKLVLKSEFLSVIEETRVKLDSNDEWKERYARYANKIKDNLVFIRGVRRSFREWSPLKVYMNTTSAKNAKMNVNFELRYLGQTVAKLTGSKDKGHKLSTKGYEITNERDFNCTICLSAADWCGEEVAEFRRHFKNNKTARNNDKNKKNEEHRLESLFLTEFSRKKGKEIRNIKPVMIGGVRFPMPTPISASDHKAVKYSKIYGGGIDILARTGTGGRATNLCIMELKDENVKSEPPKDALKQAVAYTTFIRELLRSDAKAIWWELFGFGGGNVPDRLVLYAACVMPSNKGNDYSFKDMELNINNDIIKLHYLYFTEENNKIIDFHDTSLDIKNIGGYS